MSGRLQGRIAIVTGAGCVGPGWGNGRAIAVRFAEEGARIFAASIAISTASRRPSSAYKPRAARSSHANATSPTPLRSQRWLTPVWIAAAASTFW